MLKGKLPLYLAVACLLLGALILPISNLLPRKIFNDRAGDGAFAAFTKVMQESCADCHSNEITAEPIYGRLPLASTLIARDRKEAQAVLNLSADQLRGTEPISPPDLYRIASSVSNGSMPPGRYLALHWKGISGLTEGDRRAVLKYVQGVSARIQCRPLPVSSASASAGRVELGKNCSSISACPPEENFPAPAVMTLTRAAPIVCPSLLVPTAAGEFSIHPQF